MGTIAKLVGGAVHKPSAVIHHYQTSEDAPEHKRPAQVSTCVAYVVTSSDRVQQHAQRHLHGEEEFVKETIYRIIGDVFGEFRHFFQRRHLVHHPTDVAPPEPLSRVVMIIRLV